MPSMDNIDRVKTILREHDCPFFTDADIEFYLGEYPTVNEALYNMFLVKAEDTTLKVSGLDCADTSKYFRRLAQNYRPNNSGTLRGGVL